MDEKTALVKKEEEKDFTGVVRLITYLSAFAEGYDIAVFNGAANLIEDEFSLNPVQVGLLIGSAIAIEPAGAALGGWLADKYGRIRALLATHLILFASGLGAALAPTFTFLMVARVFIGLALGMGLCVEAIYIAECTSSEDRGIMTSAVEIALNVGHLAAFVANHMLLGVSDSAWRIVLGVAAVPPFIAIGMILLGVFPESPRWLMLRGDLAGAEANLARLVGAREVKAAMERWKAEPDAGDVRLLFGSPERRRMVYAGVGVAVFQLLGGILVLMNLSSYMIESRWSMKEATFTTLIMGTFKTATLLVACFFLIDRVGRRPLLLFSAMGTAFSALFIAAAFFLTMSLAVVRIAFCAFVVIYSLGFGPVTWAYMPEVFDTNVRAAGVSLSIFVSRLVGAIVLISAPIAFNGDDDNAAPIFLFFFFANLVGFFYVYAFCPETAKRTLEEMIDLFKA